MALLSLAAGTALVTVLQLLKGSGLELVSAVESVRISEEAEIQLLVHARAQTPERSAEAESAVWALLMEAEAFTSTAEERQRLEAARSAVAAYFSDIPTAGSVEAAFEAVRSYAELNVAQARAIQQRAGPLIDLVDRLAYAAAAVLLVTIALFIWWVRTRALRPLRTVATAMVRFRQGDREARADESGSAELAHIAHSFNELATELTRQRDAQYSYFAGVAHDLRNPLNVMKLAVSRLTHAPSLPPEDKLRRTFEMLAQNVLRLERMLADVLDAAQIESGNLRIQLEPGDLAELLREVCEAFLYVSDRHTLRCDCPDGTVSATFDRVRLEQVLTNLVSNAIKYSPDGGEVTLALRTEGGCAVFQVTDQGIGMSAAEKERLFEPFRRLGASREGIPGVGLGLFVVKRIIDAHGGEVRVHSTPGAGSTFEVRLPLKPQG